MLTTGQIVLMNFAIFFGQYLIIAAALNFQYGNAGIPNMSNNLSVACGAYVTSSIVIRICMVILGTAGARATNHPIAHPSLSQGFNELCTA